MSYVFLFLFMFNGNATSYVAVPQPSMDICEHNGKILVSGSGFFTIKSNAPFDSYDCKDLSSKLPDDTTWNTRNQ